MSRRDAQLQAVAKDVRAYFTWAFKLIGVPAHQRKRLFESGIIDLCSRHLLINGSFEADEVGVNFYLFTIPEIGARDVPFVFCIPRSRDFVHASGAPWQRGKCFVGCRFDRSRLKFEAVLERILGYYGFRVEFSDTGFKPGQIFDTILEELVDEKTEFAIFDNRATEKKPNVYIEVGAAYCLDKPHILLAYKKSVLPTDFSGFLTLKYSSLKELAEQLSLRLPGFFEAHGIAARPAD